MLTKPNFDERFPVTIWTDLTLEAIRIARMLGDRVLFECGLETYTQWYNKLDSLGHSAVGTDFFPTNGRNKKLYQQVLPSVIDRVQNRAEADFLCAVIRDCPPVGNEKVCAEKWGTMLGRLGIEGVSAHLDISTFLGQQKIAQAA